MEICRYFQRLIMFYGYDSIKCQTEMAGFFQNHTQRDDQRSHLHLIQKGNIFRFFKGTSSDSVSFFKASSVVSGPLYVANLRGSLLTFSSEKKNSIKTS